jgi:hypothetical protein
MAGDQHTRGAAVAQRRRRQLPLEAEQRVDAGVAGNVNFAGYVLAAEIRGTDYGQRQQQVGLRINRRAIFLLRPRQERIVGPEARLDVRDRNARGECGERRAKRARGIALDDQQVGNFAQSRKQRRRHSADVKVRVFLARQTKCDAAIVDEVKVVRIEPAMLSGVDDRWHNAPRCERMGDWRKLDRFWPGADDQPNIRETQPSP